MHKLAIMATQRSQLHLEKRSSPCRNEIIDFWPGEFAELSSFLDSFYLWVAVYNVLDILLVSSTYEQGSVLKVTCNVACFVFMSFDLRTDLASLIEYCFHALCSTSADCCLPSDAVFPTLETTRVATANGATLSLTPFDKTWPLRCSRDVK